MQKYYQKGGPHHNRTTRPVTLTLKQIDAFNAVMNAGGVTRAAEMLDVSQPSVSRIIADLETAIGFPLFIRTARSLRPTPKARILHREVERTFLGLDHIARTAEALRTNGDGQLRVATLPSLVPLLTKTALATFARLHPAVAISLEVMPALDGFDWASAGYGDIAITSEAITSEALEVSVVGQVDAIVVLAAGHKLAQRKTLRPRDLANELFISFKPGAAFRARVDQFFASEGISRDLRYEARTTSAVCELVASLGACAIIPIPGEHIGGKGVVSRPFLPALSSPLAIVTYRERPLSTPARLFADLVEECFGASLKRGSTSRYSANRGR